jgi:hypothetical protein
VLSVSPFVRHLPLVGAGTLVARDINQGRCGVTRVTIGLSFILLVSLAVPAAAQLHRSLCADCHYVNSGKPNPTHLRDWDNSAHDRANVGCEACHGGNPNTVEPFLAHQSIVRGLGPDSPLDHANLPRTCGLCHAGPYVEFQKSQHYSLLRNGNRDGPSCSTCHGSVAAYLPNPKGLESECKSCHGVGKKFERPEYAANARILLQGVRDARELLDHAKPVIKRVKDGQLRASLQVDYDQAEVPLIQAVHPAHAFVFVNSEERLGVTRRRANALLERLANMRSMR